MCQCPNIEKFAEAMKAIINDPSTAPDRRLEAVQITANSSDEAIRLFGQLQEVETLMRRLDGARKHATATSQHNVYISKEDATKVSAHLHSLREEIQEQFRELNNYIKSVCR